jgi:hypothetical protein
MVDLYRHPHKIANKMRRCAAGQRFFQIASRMLLAGMAALALGLSAQFYVAARKVSDSVSISTIAASICAMVFEGL